MDPITTVLITAIAALFALHLKEMSRRDASEKRCQEQNQALSLRIDGMSAEIIAAHKDSAHDAEARTVMEIERNQKLSQLLERSEETQRIVCRVLRRYDPEATPPPQDRASKGDTTQFLNEAHPLERK